MLKITVTNIDKDTQDIIAFIAQKAGGKVVSAKEKAKKNLKTNNDNFTDFNKQMDDIITKVKKKHNAISANKIK
jgi:ElaB/YqjD/DUF883 family membrane-anchored ribosome-binding protein